MRMLRPGGDEEDMEDEEASHHSLNMTCSSSRYRTWLNVLKDAA